MRSLILRGGFGGGRWHPFRSSRGSSARRASSSSSSPARSGGFMQQLPLKAALTSGSLSLVGDLLAQGLQFKFNSDIGKGYDFDWVRFLRMGAWGFAFYGPYQHYWYRLLDSKFPGRNTTNFAIKVALNQLCLAPVVLTSVFSWNLTMQGQAAAIPEKIQRDLWPTMVNGWKFWVPAASVNFYFIPLQHQVLYMSSCGILWSAYLSFSSYNVMKEDGPAAPAAAAALPVKVAAAEEGKGGKKK